MYVYFIRGSLEKTLHTCNSLFPNAESFEFRILTLLTMVGLLNRFPQADAATAIAHTSHVRESNDPGRHAK